MKISFHSRMSLAAAVLAVLLVIFLVLILSLRSLVGYQEQSASIYENRLISLDYLLEADRDMYQSHLFLLQHLLQLDAHQGTSGYGRDAIINAQQALERFRRFEGLFSRDPLSPDISAEIEGFLLHGGQWLDQTRELGASPPSVDGLELYRSRQLEELFAMARIHLDILTGILLEFSGQENRSLEAAGRQVQGLIRILVMSAGISLLVFAWVGVLINRADRRLQIQQERLLEKERFAVLNTLFRNLAHMINTPLGNIITVGSHLEALPSPAAETVHESAEIINSNAERIHEIMEQIRTLDNENPGDQQRLMSCGELARHLLTVVRARPLSVRLNVSESSRIFRINPYAVGEIFSKVADNCAKFAARKEMELQVRLEKERLLLRMINQGPAIPSEKRESIFLPMETSEAFYSPGLGLYVARNLARHVLRGDLELETNTDIKVVFLCRIPVELIDNKKAAHPGGESA